MRRSAAPSQSIRKKAKFCTPYTQAVASKVLIKSTDENVIKISTNVIPVNSNAESNDPGDQSQQVKHTIDTNVRIEQIPTEKPPKKKVFSVQQQIGKSVVKTTESIVLVEEHERYFSVVWCKHSNKKHKSWEDDGILIIKGKILKLLDSEGKQIAKGSGYKAGELNNLVDGSILRIGGKEIEVQGTVTKESYVSGKCFKDSAADSNKDPINHCKAKGPPTPFQPHARNDGAVKKIKTLTPRHDASVEGALVMKRPTNKDRGEVVDVVVDPYLSSLLRPHQREGVQFLYECVMGIKNTSGCGAILADEMGLGKTLQCITVVWTLLKQGAFGKSAVKNVLIVTPGSLVKNWQKEFFKWLGSERIQPFAANSKNRVDEFLLRPKENILIISYEMFMRCIDDIRKIKFSLIICDEAHRLKNSTIKTSTLITSLGVPKIILLTGTPIQNNLEEFYTLADLAHPGILGTPSYFKRIFITPITRSQQPDCSEDEKLVATSRGEELTRLISQFCLRRTSEVNKGYLPAKVEHVVFVQSSPLQREIYTKLLKANFFRSCLSNGYNGSQHLICISALKKLCNDPRILYSSVIDKDATIYESVTRCFPEQFCPEEMTSSDSCKLVVLRNLLQSLLMDGEKLVVVANSTKALDKLQELCDALTIKNTRLDGATSTDVRQRMVDRFNSPQSDLLVFLLSSKAGGVGLNLVGASQLVLYDIDWNPANDVQAMARIWRDGQKREVHIYRLLVTGTIEEKIYQRQLQKQCLSGSVVDSLTNNKVQFSTADLKDLFTFQESKTCCTHELLQCTCDQENSPVQITAGNQKQKNLSMAELMKWEHIKDVKNEPSLASGIKECDNISFLFRNKVA